VAHRSVDVLGQQLESQSALDKVPHVALWGSRHTGLLVRRSSVHCVLSGEVVKLPTHPPRPGVDHQREPARRQRGDARSHLPGHRHSLDDRGERPV